VRGAEEGGMSAYRDARVLVLGGLGFIGSNLTRHLADAGAHVTAVTRSIDRHKDAAAGHEARGIRVMQGDLRDPAAMALAVQGQDVVFNAAGQSGAVRSLEDPWTDLDVNLRGSLVLLEALRSINRHAKVVFVGSRLEYGRVGAGPVAEDHPVDPLCVHAIHKLAAEKYLRLYEQLFGVRFAVARVTNPYGPGQPVGRTTYGVVNRMIHLALADQALTVYGSGDQRRDYIYIDDVSAALAALGAAPASDGRIYNVGTGVGTSIAAMARTIVELAGAGRVDFVEWPSLAEQIETGDFVADISRIGREIGWRPRVALADGLKQTMALLKPDVRSVKFGV
jgi:UDP-glucose 4-epimerase